MNLPIEMVFLDIDGTLVTGGRIMDSARYAITELRRKGVPVALCTGRSVLHTVQVQKSLDIDHAVYFNGGLVVSGGQTLHSSPLHDDVVGRILAFCDEDDLSFVLHTDEHALATRTMPTYVEPLLRDYDYPTIQTIGRDKLAHNVSPIFQVNVFMTQSWDQLAQNQLPECLLYRWHDEAVDLQKRGCDKAIGAQFLLDQFHIQPRHALHIGDGANDIGLFKFIGTSVAMGNAPLEVQRHATRVTSSVDQNGVYYALLELGLIDPDPTKRS